MKISHSPPLNPAPLRPRIAPPATPSRELRAKTHGLCTWISGKHPFHRIYANRSVLHGAVKTLTDINQWRNSGNARVQHMRSKGRAVYPFGISRFGFPFFIQWAFLIPTCGSARARCRGGSPRPPSRLKKTESLRVCFHDGTGNLIIFPV